MTLKKAIESFDSRRANDIDGKTKTEWLSELDMKINAELFTPRGMGTAFEGYTSLTPGDTVLCAPKEYEEIYFLYLVMKDDFLNAEMQRYNNSAFAFNALYAEMGDFLNRTSRVKSTAYLKAGGLYD